MSEPVRVRFAPSPTGKVHIGNIRVAIFNWLFARRSGGSFLLRIEDTDLERSTPEAVQAVLEAMEWLGLNWDAPPVYQSAQRARHDQAADRLLNFDHAYRNSDALPAVVLKIDRALFDPSFVTEPGTEAAIDLSRAAALRATARSLVIVDRSPDGGQEFLRPVPWDAIEAGLSFTLADGTTVAGAAVFAAVRERCGPDLSAETSCDLAEAAGGRATSLTFRRRHVFFDDLILGRMEKPLDSLRDMVVVRGDGSPVFHLANVVDDATMGITHILRGNDHVENTFRHLFLFRGLGRTPPRYGHFPMIVNAQGKPYSKRDGDAYVGDFRDKGFLPEALFNFLALCGWSPGDDREQMSRQELAAAFSLERVSKSPAQFNLEKLEWLNSQYLRDLPEEEYLAGIREALAAAGLCADEHGPEWLRRFATVMRERVRALPDLPAQSAYFFGDSVTVAWEEKPVRKVTKKAESKEMLQTLRLRLAALPEWSEEALDATVRAVAEEKQAGLGAVAQPLRIAVTGGTVSPGIQETLALLGRERSLKRIDAALEAWPTP